MLTHPDSSHTHARTHIQKSRQYHVLHLINVNQKKKGYIIFSVINTLWLFWVAF